MLSEVTATHGKSSDDQSGLGNNPHKSYTIHIDRQMFKVDQERMTGLALRALPTPSVDETRDLFEVVPGGLDVLVGDGDVVELKEGMHFVTAPRDVTPGSCRGC
jgi:hypothetical protein